MLRMRLGHGVRTCIAGQKDLHTLAVVAFRDGEIRIPFAVDQDLVDLDLVLLVESTQSAVDDLVRVDRPWGELVDG